MRILITAGPTREAIDPVRFISNRSSGKMGYALAEAALERGHEVLLISGPVKLETPQGVIVEHVESTFDMYDAVRTQIGEYDAAVFCAAVADYRMADIAEQKIKKQGETLTLELVKTEDILGSCREKFGFDGTLMGFAAETENLEENAIAKLKAKACDFLVANDVSRRDIGFERDQNEVILFSSDGTRQLLPRADKVEIAQKLIAVLEGTS